MKLVKGGGNIQEFNERIRELSFKAWDEEMKRSQSSGDAALGRQVHHCESLEEGDREAPRRTRPLGDARADKTLSKRVLST
jgi:hypothetical protein